MKRIDRIEKAADPRIMTGEIVFISDSFIMAKLEDGTLVRHERAEHLFKVGDMVETTPSGGATVYMVATQGHVYLTPDFVGKGTFDEKTGWIK